MKLIVFDMDQTLVNVQHVHDSAVQVLFDRMFGVKASLYEIDFAGRSIEENLLNLAGKKEIKKEYLTDTESIVRKYQEIFVEKLPPDASDTALPGVPVLLKALYDRGHIIGLYTGDSDEIARAVLKAASLDAYFAFTVGSNQADTRTDQLKLAKRNAEQITNSQIEKENIVVIGDSIHDVDSGKDIGAVTISVATGPHTEQDLWKHQPDYVFGNLEDTDAILKAIEGRVQVQTLLS